MTFIKPVHSHTDLKPRFVLVVHFMYYVQVLSVPLLCNEGIVNIQVLCSISLNMKVLSMILAMPSYFKLKEHRSLA